MILCLGPSPTVQRTMTFGRLRLDGVNRTADVRDYASGKSVNNARVLKTLGADALATGYLGGRRGEFLRADLDATGIPHDFVTVDHDTRLCTTIVDQGGRTATELVEEPADLTPADADALIMRLPAMLNTDDGPARMLILSGTLPTGLGEDFYARCCHASAAAGVPVILDARSGPLKRAAAERPFLVKPNRLELAETLGAEIGTQSALLAGMRKLAEIGPRWVVVTQGTGPTLAADARGAWQVATPRLEPLNPIGSGDAFAAGLAFALTAGGFNAVHPDAADVPAALKLAVACGAANAAHPYTGHVDPALVSKLLRDVRVNPL